MRETAAVKVEPEYQANAAMHAENQIATEETSEIGDLPIDKPETAKQRLTQKRLIATKSSVESGQTDIATDQVRLAYVN